MAWGQPLRIVAAWPSQLGESGRSEERVISRENASPCSFCQRRGAVIRRLTIKAEIDFLLGERNIGQRVELTTMTSDQFVALVERKLIERRDQGGPGRRDDEAREAFVRERLV
jgi:hypothetical protein